MKKSTKVLTFLSAILLCAAFVFPLAVKANADEEFAYGEVDVVSIAPPYVREVNATLNHYIFTVYFDGDITYANYKHIAASASFLKGSIGHNNPALTAEAVDFFDQNGVIKSIRENIYFNGKSVDEYNDATKGINTACMIHLGDLGVNNCMNIEFGSDFVPLSKNLDESYEFEFKAGLKLPSGVVLKNDSVWKYSLSDKTFERVGDTADASDAGFIINYNGKAITSDNNVFTVYSKDGFSMDNLYIRPNNYNATVTIEKTFEELEAGLNYILITCTSENGKKTNDMQLVIRYAADTTEKSAGCGAGISHGAGVIFLAISALILRRKAR